MEKRGEFNNLVEMSIETIRISTINNQRAVMLKVKNRNLYLPIWVDPKDGDTIAILLKRQLPSPPATEVLLDVVSKLGAHVDKAVISEIRDDTVYANIVLSTADGKRVEIDSRPSHAIALALRANAPLYAEESPLEHAGISMGIQQR